AAGGRGARWVVSGVPQMTAHRWASDLYVRAEWTTDDAVSPIPAPTRVALYKSAPGIIDEGWTEWLLDTNGFHYTIITPADLHTEDLASRYDVILLASQGAGTGDSTTGPAEDSLRVRAFDTFVRAGGTLVAWNQGAAAT